MLIMGLRESLSRLKGPVGPAKGVRQMRRYRSIALLAVLAALAVGCTTAGSAAEPADGTVTSAGDGSAALTPELPAKHELTAPQAVGDARKIIREGYARQMGVQLASLFVERSPTAVAAGFDINKPFYFAGVNLPRPYPQDLAGQADLALKAAPLANTSNTTLTLATTPAQGYATQDTAMVLHCTVATLRGSASSYDLPVCAWADSWTIGVVLAISTKIETGQGAAGLQAAADLTIATRTAAMQPSP
ncbi:hypothetical protein [Kitasatospora herbaricolor]|uniref:PknH-like protein n=1 Tax=Kitasatospora herbaricolor TaxID=68217 RepID=A0ABZ1WJT5_9ACTN|nr:hypothetical protein [Kitasatospora herbaricolor]